MCGIFSYLGRPGNASKSVIEWLKRLEYRWYDSAGICLVNHEKHVQILKSVGRVLELKRRSDSYDFSTYHVGIGHTRWATHGKVTETNCHPHYSDSGRFMVVHNGIIENYAELKSMLIEKGCTFYSETDTEVLAKLYEDCYTGDHMQALELLANQISGAYGMVFIDKEHPDRIFWAKKGSPLVIGFWNEEQFVSSDYRSLIGLIDNYIVLEDGDMFLLTPETYTVLNTIGTVDRMKHTILEEEKVADLGVYPHFMLKEIFEQPDVLQNVFRGRIDFENHSLHSDTLESISQLSIEKITIVASGTSYHAWLLGKYYLEELANIQTDVIVSTEFKYKKQFINSNELYIFVSQSWETADTLDSLKIVKERWGHVFWIVNVPGSSIARVAAQWLFTRAGIEVWVASTKAFVAQVACFLFMALYLGKNRWLDYKKYRAILDALSTLSEDMRFLLAKTEEIRSIAIKYQNYRNFFYLWRSHELPIAMEWSLKLKELTYCHSEAYSSGELKHWSIALIDENFPSIMINGGWPLAMKNNSSVEEIRARSWKVIGIISDYDTQKNLYDDYMCFTPTIEEVNPFLEILLLQLFSYHMANSLGRDVDKPRNLAKSVTVE